MGACLPLTARVSTGTSKLSRATDWRQGVVSSLTVWPAAVAAVKRAAVAMMEVKVFIVVVCGVGFLVTEVGMELRDAVERVV